VESDVVRMNELAAKARAGDLTHEEDHELQDFLRVGNVLERLKSEARQTLRTSTVE
jgi:uncharacterized protein YnzC (UPF0291/DUF896 family)